ncbi:MAG: DNA polymerase III subunit epsilon [Gammaproteobacteria bacterium]|nr:DNA polymerase III subunit epsilon [Gammaproteobacteria bacterium]MDP2349225.1 DNA polymerase III subunit epsilon [Gammaproteobacteria bacterium]
MRQIVLDTETTGLDPAQGHRVIEIGCVEIENRRLTGRHFHCYLNPDREIDEGAVQVHGITTAFLADKPRFPQIVEDFLRFVAGAELVIHNAPFDLGFLNSELQLVGNYPAIETQCTVTDTLVMARKKHPGQRNSLDALCKRYEVDNSQRDLHGALLDAEILADVYLLMTGGQTNLLLGSEENVVEKRDNPIRKLNVKRGLLVTQQLDDEEAAAHQRLLERINKDSRNRCIWTTQDA